MNILLPKPKRFKVLGQPKAYSDVVDYIDFFGSDEDVRQMMKLGEVVFNGNHGDAWRLKIDPHLDTRDVYDYMKEYEKQVNQKPAESASE